MDRVFSIFGCPLVIISDNGRAFANNLMKASEALYGFRWIYVMPNTPQANGLAEAAVKKLKIILDRHTTEYQNWLPIISMAQMTVNQRTPNGQDPPFTGVFGWSPPTLAALENPELLPAETAHEKSIRTTAITMSRLHDRLKREVENLKEATAAAHVHHSPKRQVQSGDKVWLIYSDPERARYIRKHGHGRAWRHAFKVVKVKPHAVKLEVPTDGSVPEVLHWQSLRKCSFAAPYFHDPDMVLPDVNEQGAPLMPEDYYACHDPSTTPSAHTSTPETDEDKEYEIERIVGATKLGGGWRLMVKWKDYPDATPEPMWKILKQTNHPDIIRDIKRCKDDYYSLNPSERDEGE